MATNASPTDETKNTVAGKVAGCEMASGVAVALGVATESLWAGIRPGIGVGVG